MPIVKSGGCMDAKAWGIFIGVVVIIIGGMVYMSTQNRLDVSDISGKTAASVLAGEERSGGIGDHVLGNRDAKVVVVEYGDFQCPGCATAAPRAKAIAEKYKDSVALVFRNFPLTTIHPNARAAAATAEAAGLQGKFWEMHDVLFTNQGSWQSTSASERASIFAGYAEQLGLDVGLFTSDVASDVVTRKIDFDIALGKIKKVTGTPAFFVNGSEINTAADMDALETAIKEALKSAGVTVKPEEE